MARSVIRVLRRHKLHVSSFCDLSNFDPWRFACWRQCMTIVLPEPTRRFLGVRYAEQVQPKQACPMPPSAFDLCIGAGRVRPRRRAPTTRRVVSPHLATRRCPAPHLMCGPRTWRLLCGLSCWSERRRLGSKDCSAEKPFVSVVIRVPNKIRTHQCSRLNAMRTQAVAKAVQFLREFRDLCRRGSRQGALCQ